MLSHLSPRERRLCAVAVFLGITLGLCTLSAAGVTCGMHYWRERSPERLIIGQWDTDTGLVFEFCQGGELIVTGRDSGARVHGSYRWIKPGQIDLEVPGLLGAAMAANPNVSFPTRDRMLWSSPKKRSELRRR